MRVGRHKALVRLTAFSVALFAGMSAIPVHASTSYAWNQQSPASSPPARYAAGMVYDPAIQEVVLFGGFDNPPPFLNDTWVYNGTNWTQIVGAPGCTTACASSPPGLYGASMVYDPATGNVVLFGGVGNAGPPTHETWTFNGTAWTHQVTAASPPIRNDAMMTYDEATHEVVLFGGVDNSGLPINDTWTYDGSTWTQVVGLLGCTDTCGNSPSARNGAAMVYDPANGQVVLFGGVTVCCLLADTWYFNGITWVQQSPATSANSRVGAAYTWDPSANAMVLFGGDDTGSLVANDTWTYDGTTWTQLFGPAGCISACTDSPVLRKNAMMTYDAATNQAVLFGGANFSSLLNDTWTFSATAISPIPVPATGAAKGFGMSQLIPAFALGMGLLLTITAVRRRTGRLLN